MWRQKEISQKLLLKLPSQPPQILAPFLMGKRLTLLPERHECTSACPNKPAKRKMQHEQTVSNEGYQNESGRCRAHTWLSAAWGGRSDTQRDGGSQTQGGECSPSCTSDPYGRAKVPCGSRAPPVEARDGWVSSTALAHPPSVPPWVVPCPSKTHRDARAVLAPPGKLCRGLPQDLMCSRV